MVSHIRPRSQSSGEGPEPVPDPSGNFLASPRNLLRKREKDKKTNPEEKNTWKNRQSPKKDKIGKIRTDKSASGKPPGPFSRILKCFVCLSSSTFRVGELGARKGSLRKGSFHWRLFQGKSSEFA